VVHAHFVKDSEGRGFYVTAVHSLVSDGWYQAYVHPPTPILAWLVQSREAAERWICRKLSELGHETCGELCHRHEEA
jgi:hypothetical protein